MIRTAIMSVAAVALMSGAASAESRKIVSTRFADFSNPEHVEVVYNEIVEAAYDVCSVSADRSSLLYRHRVRDEIETCAAETLEDTLEEAGIAALTEYHQAHSAAMEAAPSEVAFIES